MLAGAKAHPENILVSGRRGGIAGFHFKKMFVPFLSKIGMYVLFFDADAEDKQPQF
jgi:hypothetical protein